MDLAKASVDGGRQKYVTLHSKPMSLNNKYIRVLKDGILTMESAGNILVVKTVSGMAMAVGAAIDAMNIKEVVGCIAGDDTIMCAIKNADDTKLVKASLEKYIK